MACLYVTEQGANLRAVDGKFVVECKDGKTKVCNRDLGIGDGFWWWSNEFAAHRECLRGILRLSFFCLQENMLEN